MKLRWLTLGSAALLAPAAIFLACVGDTPATPPGTDSGIDSNPAADGGSDGATPLLACQAGETLETFEEPMNQSTHVDLCTVAPCDLAVTNGVSYSGGVFKAAIDYAGGSSFAFSARSHEATGKPNVAEAIVTYELTVDSITRADGGGWQSVGCLLDQTEYDAGTLTGISRVEIATNGSAGSAFTYFNGNRAGGSNVALPGFTLDGTTPMTISIRLERRATTKATISLSSSVGSGSINLTPVNAPQVNLSCGVGRESAGISKISVRKLRYARCIKP